MRVLRLCWCAQGLKASLLGAIPYSAVRLGSYDGLKWAYKKVSSLRERPPHPRNVRCCSVQQSSLSLILAGGKDFLADLLAKAVDRHSAAPGHLACSVVVAPPLQVPSCVLSEDSMLRSCHYEY